MEFIVDIQGFTRPFNDFVLKELAIVPLEDDALPSVYLFEPPQRWSSLLAKYKSTNLWLELNYHGIPWNSGDVSYDEVHEVLQNLLQEAYKIHVKGLEKKRWLERIVPNVYNLEDLNCPSLEKLRDMDNNTHISCSNHSLILSTPHCAAYNVHMLKAWLLKESSDAVKTECNPSTPFTTLQNYYAQCDFT